MRFGQVGGDGRSDARSKPAPRFPASLFYPGGLPPGTIDIKSMEALSILDGPDRVVGGRRIGGAPVRQSWKTMLFALPHPARAIKGQSGKVPEAARDLRAGVKTLLRKIVAPLRFSVAAGPCR
ncbi:hypothetical protein [Pseudohoeflea coraliihabitans]|uniref:Uncharacterized protein n=1 Tax=Pseudohoeflea coraliihabitans TaxID=2860393 RepID=A0ABS6WPS1_9HYPH|nr:hypothetical protein [Pseudohoeflea sp. DP4N28-3]MBW3097946.1 hypothetical protein [Pseudohoeflea sp. DP4N28-3]